MSSWPSSYTGNTSNGTQRFSSAFVDQTGPLYGHETATSGTSVTGADSSRPQKRKRISLACVGCKARKVRCDKKIPCEQCIKRGEESFCKPDQPFDAQGRDLSASNVQQKKSSPSSADSLAQVGNSFPPPEGQQNNIDVASPPVWPASALEDLASLRARVSTLEQALVQQMPSITPLLQKHHKSLSTERFGLSQNIKPVTSTKGGEGDLSSEDAAQVLEDLAINGAPSSTNTFTAGSSPQSQSNQLYPSIAVSPMYSSLQRSVMELLFPKIPPDQNLREAVELYLKEVGWIFPVIIEPQMRAELEEFLSLRQHGQIHHVDPAWLAELYIVLAMSTSALHHQGDGLSNEEAVNVCQTFYDASRLCLEVANWSSNPQLRTLRTVLLFVSWMSLLPSPTVPTTNQRAQISLKMRPLPHVASAVRMSQYLGLDKLWKSREEMPLLPDPAVPERPSLLARQIGARLWTTTVFLEDTPRPPVGNYNDEDLGWDLYTPERPSTEWTSGSVDGFKAQLATLGMRTLNLRRTDSVCHEDVYKFDEEMKEVLNHQVVPQSICDTLKLKLMESGIHYRILRLHRPYMVKGLQDSQFRRSYDTALSSAITIVTNLSFFNDFHCLTRFWWICVHVMGASVTLATALLAQLEKDPNDPTVDTCRSNLQLVAVAMDEVAAKPNVAIAQPIATYVCKLTKRLLEVEREKRGPCGSKGHCVASVLADVACSLRQAQEADPKHVNPPEAALPVTETQTAQEWLDNLQLMQPFLDVSVMNPEYLVGGHSTPLPDSDETFSFNPAFAVTT